MKRMSFRFSDDLMDWLKAQAVKNHRSINKQAEHFLSRLKQEDEKAHYQLGLNKLCSNGMHYFVSSNPAMNEFCNCRMYVYGEVTR